MAVAAGTASGVGDDCRRADDDPELAVERFHRVHQLGGTDAQSVLQRGVVDPLCKVGRDRVYRGGSWFDCGSLCRSAYRLALVPGFRIDFLGFRVCLVRSPAGAEP